MAKRRMLSDEVLYSDDFLDLSCEAFKLYIYAMIETDSDGIFNSTRKILLNTQTDKKHLKELEDKGFIQKEPKEEVYAITDFHIHNRMDKNGGQNQNRYTETKHITFKNILFVSENSRLTLNEKEGCMPYKLYQGGAMSGVLSNYKQQVEMMEDAQKRKDDILEEAKKI